MSTPADFWLALSRGGHVEELEREECLNLLAAVKVGRVGYVVDGAPRVVPVNFALVEGSIVVRTLAYGELARHALNAKVAFEVDGIDEFFRTGWSVLVVSTARLLDPAQLGRQHPAELPEPWAEGPRTLFLEIPITHLSGRRVLPSGR